MESSVANGIVFVEFTTLHANTAEIVVFIFRLLLTGEDIGLDA